MASKLPPPELIRRIAKGWLVLGILGFLFICAFMVSHFCFGTPVLNKDTGQYMSDSEIGLMFGLMASGFGLFAALGAWILSSPENKLINGFFGLAVSFVPPWFRK